MNNLKDFNQFINESSQEHYMKRKVKDWHAAEDHLEKEGVMWTDLDFENENGVGFKDGEETIGHFDNETGHLYIYNDPMTSYSSEKIEDTYSDDSEDYKEEYREEEDEEETNWDDENNWELEDLPFDEEY